MISLSYADRRTRLGTLILDLTLTEEVGFASEVSAYPVEDGVTISDHVTQGAETLRVRGEIPTVDVYAGEADDEGRMKVVDVVEACRRIHAAREVLEISTGQTLYTDFAFTNLTATRSADGGGGNWLSIQAELTKVRKVSLRTAEVPEERRVATTDGAQGRSGQTNKPAGKGASAPGRGPSSSPGVGSSSAGGGAAAARKSPAAALIDAMRAGQL